MTSKFTPPVRVLRGRRVLAAYHESPVPDYVGNPLIEALPPIYSDLEAAGRMAVYPRFDEAQRSQPAHIRLHLIQAALRFFVALPVHLDLEQRFSRMIRVGYQGRNPTASSYFGDLNQRLEGFAEIQESPTSIPTGFTILGMSGVGKTSALTAVLRLYPQVVIHSRYGDREFDHLQLVWLKLDCPYDGSTKGLCLNFFQAVDDLLGTAYYESYAAGRRTVDELIPRMARVASLHSLGVLVVDEMQHLSGAKSGGGKLMLNFFVTLSNELGLPVVLVGTYKAQAVLAGELRQIRRGTGQGDLIWDNMQPDEVWDFFLESLFRYQYLLHPTSLTTELNQTLYEISQGITDFAVKIFMLAQFRAIATREEKLSARIFRSVAKDSLRSATSVLTALRNRDYRILTTLEDVHPIDLEPYLHEARQRVALRQLRENQPSERREPATPALESPASGTDAGGQSGPPPKPGLRTGLQSAIAQGVKRRQAAYEALNRAGFIRAAREFLLPSESAPRGSGAGHETNCKIGHLDVAPH